MHLTPQEQDRLLVFAAAQFARAARDRGLLLSAPEAVALLADEVHWAARGGADLEGATRAGMTALTSEQVLPGVPAVVDEVRVEPLFDEGTKLVVLRWPLGRPEAGPVRPGDGAAPQRERERRQLEVVNTGDHVVRIGSHTPFHLVNPRLSFDRDAAEGWRLALPAGGLARFGPGERAVVDLVRLT